MPDPATSRKLQEDAINAILATILKQEGTFKLLCYKALDFIHETKQKLNQANALFIDGVLQYYKDPPPALAFLEAEALGCDHPLLYHFLGECYREDDKGVPQDDSKAAEYYIKAINGMSFLVIPCVTIKA